jgi:C-terminal binding-module, SLH-like, of glucodextranase
VSLHPALRQSAAAALLAGALVLPAAALWAAKEPIFTLTDPQGDDNGDGTLSYPANYHDLAPGDLDLLSLSARRVDGGTELEATFANSVRSTARRTSGGTSLDAVARHGFYTANVDIYIDTDGAAGSGAVQTLPGRGARIASANAWEKAICLTPRPSAARSTLKRILLKQLERDLRAKQEGVDAREARRLRRALPAIESRIFFPDRIRVAGSSIRFFVPDSFLGGPARPTWSYVVVVTGTDIEQRFDTSQKVGVTREADNLFVLPIASGSREDRFGGAQEEDPLQPPIVDLIVPAGFDQQRVLRDYDLRTHKPVQLPGIVPAEYGKIVK